MIRRILFVLGILPVAIYAFVRWIVTGKDTLELMMRFGKWGDAL